MSFLEINSWPVEVMVDNGERAVDDIGTRVRSAAGSLRRTSLAQKPVFKGASVPLTETVAESLEQFLRGNGWHFSFDADLYSGVSGVGPSSGYNVSIGSTGTTKFGNKLIAGVTTATTILTYPLELGTAYTLMWWQQSGTSGTWNHYVKRNTGDAWLNGSQTNPGTQSVVVSSGSVLLKGNANDGTTGTTQCFDDLVVLPFYLCDEAIPYFAARAAAFSDLPELFLTGDAEQETSVTVLGNLEGSKFIPGSGVNNLRQVRFSLDAV